ncbi:receptor-like protein kinase FERONIA [Bidens hawaiensis]|uniref:receptor-like protein kinase FERONIA n=1 Tax=Bidens hawaiensis TaxID=980011 RepID=UPI00404B8995
MFNTYFATTTDRRWVGDQISEFVPSDTITTTYTITNFTLDPSDTQTPYSSARIFPDFAFTYTFPVSEGPKFLRLYFYAATYFEQSLFSVSSNGYSLLNNFSASLTASLLAKTRSDVEVHGYRALNFVKEYIIYVKDTQVLNVTFTPAPNSYAFINGIEIVSMPGNLYFNSKSLKPVGMTNEPDIAYHMALENIYRLNMGGGYISGTQDTGMYRSWDQDNNYVYPASYWKTSVYDKRKPIMYTMDTRNYTAPEPVYRTQRSMSNMSNKYNLTWILPVDSGFYYSLRLHFCNIIPQYNRSGQVVFKIFINNQTAADEIDLFQLTQDSGYPVFKDYVVYVNDPDGSRGRQDLWVAMRPNPNSEPYHDAYLNGLEVFKLSMNRSLASPNLKLTTTIPPTTAQATTGKRNKKKPPYAVIIGCISGARSLVADAVVWSDRRGGGWRCGVVWRPALLCETVNSELCEAVAAVQPLSRATRVYCDSVSAIYLKGNPVQIQCTKHVKLDIHLSMNMFKKGALVLFACPLGTKLQISSPKAYRGRFLKTFNSVSASVHLPL